MEKVIKGTLFKTPDKKMNISGIMCYSPKSNNFIERTIEYAKELGYRVIKK